MRDTHTYLFTDCLLLAIDQCSSGVNSLLVVTRVKSVLTEDVDELSVKTVRTIIILIVKPGS